MADVAILGGGVASLYSTALSQTLGTQKTYYATQVNSTYVGSNPKLQLWRDGTKVFERALSGAAAITDGTIVLPTTWSGSATTHDAADIDSGAWLFRLVNASDGSKYLEGSAGKPGSGAHLIVSRDLDGTLDPVINDPIVFQTSSSLDADYVPPGTGIPLYSPQTTVDDMGLPNDAKGYGASNYYVTADQPGDVPAAVSFGVRQNPKEQADWIRGELQNTSYWNILWRYMYPWLYTFTVTGHNATNIRLRISKAKLLVRNRSTKQWSVFMSATSNSYSWAAAALGNGQSLDDYPTLNVRSANGGTEVVVPNMFSLAANQRYNLHGFWAGQTYLDASSYDCIMHSCLAQLVLDNPAGADDRANAKLMMHLGGDFYPAQGGNNSSGGLFGRFIPFPGFASSRLKFVTATPKWFGDATLLNARQDYITLPGTTVDNAISVQSFLANPPPQSLIEA